MRVKVITQEELPDNQLATLITYLKYYSTFSFPVKLPPGQPLEKAPEWPLIQRGFMSGDIGVVIHRWYSPTGDVVKDCNAYLQVTEVGQQYVQDLGDKQPIRLARLCCQLFYLNQAVAYIKALSIGELPPFLTNELSTIREAALERYKELVNETDESTN